jgi:hypothetical protein
VITSRSGDPAAEMPAGAMRLANGLMIAGVLSKMRTWPTAVSFGLVCLFTIVVGVVGTLRLNETDARTEAMYRDNLLAIKYVGAVDKDAALLRFQLTNMLIAPTALKRAALSRR